MAPDARQKRRITILGSTGSIGTSTLDVVRQLGGQDRYEVLALTEGTMDPALIRTGLSFAALHPAEDADFDPLPMADRPDPRRAHLRLVH